jgi:pimeloyl-ACP methyl ester carboxylesterase
MYAFLSNDWSGIVVALIVAVIGFGIVDAGGRITRKFARRTLLGVGWFVLVIGALLTLTSSYHAISVVRMWARHPAPGRMIDVGGYEMHLLAEGENNGKPTLVWVPGGHSAGYNFYNCHKIFREETRSILFDLPATGWSDVGPFPRTTSREVDEFHRMMQAAGETEPIVLIGHSYGGLFASTYAIRYPDNLAGLMLLDSGPVENWENPDAAGFMKMYSRLAFVDAALLGFGIPVSIQFLMGGEAVKELMAHYERELTDVWAELTALNRAAMNGYGTASIFLEIGTPEFFTNGRTIPGVLDGKPATYITFLGGLDLDSREAVDTVLTIRPDLDEAGALGQLEGLKRNRQYITSLSDQMQSVSVPDDASHNFPYERPAFVTDMVRDLLARIADTGAVEENIDESASEIG